METLKRHSFLVFAALLFALPSMIVTSRSAAAYSSPTASRSVGLATGPAGMALSSSDSSLQPDLLHVAQESAEPLTLDDCYTLMATLALTGTPTLTNTVDADGIPTLTCAGVMTGTVPLRQSRTLRRSLTLRQSLTLRR
jgi:hypothetical protein